MSDNSAPKVSVVVRCFDQETTVGRAIESLLAQDLSASDFEIIVVDDGSRDGSAERVKAFRAKVSAYCDGRNRGNIGAAYFGLEKARGRYFCMLDADDTAEPALLRRMAQALDGRPSAALAYCDYCEIDERGRRRVVRINDRVMKLLACNLMYQRETLLREGFFDETLLLPEYDLNIRLLSRYDGVHVAAPLYNRFRHNAAMTRQEGFVERALAQISARYGALAPQGELKDLRISACAGRRLQQRGGT